MVKNALKKTLLLAAFVGLSGVAHSATGPLVVINNLGLAYSTNVVENLQQYISPNTPAYRLAAQVTWSSAAIASQTFTDGTQSTGSITVASTNLLSAAATDQITVPATSAILGSPATAQITVLSTSTLGAPASSFAIVISTSLSGVYVGINTSRILATPYITSTTSGTASNLATALNALSGATGVAVSWGGGASSTIFATTTVNGVFSTYAITSSSTPLVSSGTFTGGQADATITINGAPFKNGVQWNPATTSSGTAQNIAAAMQGYGAFNAAWGGGTSTVIYATSTVTGTAGNSNTLTLSAGTSLSTTSWSGGTNDVLRDATITFNGFVGRNGYEWTDASGLSTGTAASIAGWLDSFSQIASTNTSSVVYSTASTAGKAGNAFTLTASTTAISVNSATFTGGQDTSVLTINGKTFTAGVDYTTSTVNTTASHIATAITNSSNTINVTAAATGAVVNTTSTIFGASTNYPMSTNTTSYLTLSNPTMTGGSASAYAINSATITIANNGFTLALPVLYSTGTLAIGGLTNQTTYYVIPVTANTFELSSTSTGAVAGIGIVITSSNTPSTTTHTYTLAPTAFSQGNAAAKWRVSNDGINWADYTTTAGNIAVSSNTFSAVYPSSTSVQDFGITDYGYLEYAITGPSGGAVNLKVILNAKE